MKKTIKYLQDGEYHYATVKDVGDLEQLKTQHKEDLVTALNELFTTGGDSKTNGYDDLVKKVNDTQTSLNGVNSKVDGANSKINDITSNGGGTNLIVQSDLKPGYLDRGNGGANNNGSYDFHSDNYIPTNGATVFTLSSPDYVFKGSGNHTLAMYDSDKNFLGYQLITSPTQTLSKSNTTYIRFSINFVDEGGFADRLSDWLSTHRYMLEKGIIAHDWQPSPEDVNADISNVNTKIDQTANGINNTITDINGKVVANDEAIAQAKKDLQDALAQFQTFNDEIDQAKKDAETELANAKQSLKDEFNTNLANAQKANQKQLEDRIATIQGNLDTTSNTLNDVKTQLTNAKLDYGAVNTSIQKLNDTLSTKLSSTDLDPLRTSIQSQETEIQQAKDSIATKTSKAEFDVLSGRVGNAEAKIKQQADEISLGVKKSELNGAIDNYQIEGANRLRNTLDFDIDGGYWKLDQYSINSNTDVHPYDQAHDVSALVLQKAGSAKQDVDFTNEDLGQSFVISMWNKKDAQPQVWYGNTQLTNRQVADIKGDYERSFFTFIPTNVNVKTIMFKYDAGTANQLIIGEPKLELGTKPKAYAPNPNDEHKQIVNTKAELKIASDKIESAVEKQTKTDNNITQLSSRITQTEQGITATNDLITKTKDGLIKDYTGKINANAKSLSSEFEEKTNEKIGQITDSGENLILNSAFTNETDRKDKWQNISDKVNIVSDGNGLMWAKMSQSGLTTDNPISLTSNYFPIKQGKITVGVDIKSDNTNGLSGAKILVLQTYNANKQRVDFTELSLENMGLTISQLADGQSHRGVYRLGNDRSDAVYMTVKAVLPRNGSIYFTNFSAKLSSIDNGGYTPNADDLKRQILNQKTKIEQNSQQITLKASSTELSDVRTIANGAVSVANQANSNANTANTNATNAVSVANSANNNANQAKSNANSAVTTANSAKSTADSANNNANSAVTKADNAVNTANQAKSNATQAVTTANQANSKINDIQANGGGRNLVQNTDQDFVVDDTTNTGTQGWRFWIFTLTQQLKVGDQITVSAEGTLTGRGNLSTYDAILYDPNTSCPRSESKRLTAGKRSSVTLEVNNLNGTGDTVLLIYAGNIADTEGKKNIIHHLMVEKGTVAHDWSPAPEDIQTQIDQARTDIQSTLTVANNGITAATNLKTTYDNYVQKNDANIKLLGDRITNEVSKITSNGGGRNLARSTSSNWVDIKDFDNEVNYVIPLANIYLDTLQVGDTMTYSVMLKNTGITSGSFTIHGDGNATGWGNGELGGNHHTIANDLPAGTTKTFVFTTVISEAQKQNEYFKLQLRTDNIPKGGTLSYRCVLAEKGTIVHDWTPAPEDTNSAIEAVSSKIDQTATSITSTVNSTKQDLQGQINSANTKITQTANNITEQLKSYSKTGDMQNYVNTTVQKTADGITAKVSGVESKIDNLNTSDRNLARGTSNSWTDITGFDNRTNYCVYLANVYLDGLNVGDVITCGITLKNTGITAGTMWIQGSGNVTGWNDGSYYGPHYDIASTIPNGTEKTLVYTITLTANMIKNSFWDTNMRTDNVPKGGTLSYKCFFVKKGNISTAWSPAPEDVDAKITTNSTAIEQNKKAITLKADQTTVDQTNGNVQRLQSQLNVQADQISAKVSDVESKVNNANNRLDNLKSQAQWVTVTDTVDLNNIKTPCHEFLKGAVTNAPNEVAWWYLTVEGSEGNRITQTVIADQSNNRYTRRFADSWSAWVKVANQNDVNSAIETTKTDLVQQITEAKNAAIKVSKDSINSEVSDVRTTITQVDNKVSGVESKVDSTKQDLQGKIDSANTKIDNTNTKIDQTATSINDKVSGVESKVDNANNKIDNLQIGGRNLLIGSKTMHYVWVADGTSIFNVDDYLAVRATDNNMRIYQSPREDTNGELMSVSFDAEVPTDSNNQSVQIWVGPFQAGVSVTISGNTFKRYKVENWKWNSVNKAFSIQFKNANDKIDIKNIKLEFGSKATDWTPAPEDVQSQIDANKTSAANAQTSANNAQNTANSANSTASNAVNTANTANTNANSALTKANSAVNTANTANTTANSANTTANTANTNASNAVSVANSAKSTADSANNTASSAVNTANTANTTANQANNKISNIQANGGGRNLLQGTGDFSGGNWLNLGTAWTKTDETYNGLSVVETTGDWSGISQYYQVKKGETYTFSLYARYTSGTGTSSIYVLLNSNPESGHQSAQLDIGQLSCSLDTNWKKCSVTFTATTDGYIKPRMERTNANTNVLRVCGFMLEKGTIAHDWSPAPEDTATDISNVNTKIDQTATNINATVNNTKQDLQDKIDNTNTKIDQTATSITSTVNNTKQDLQDKIDNTNTKIDQTANDINDKVDSAKQDLQGQISNVDTKVEQYKTGINQTATGMNLFAQVITGNKDIDVTKSNIGIDPSQIKIASNKIVIDGNTSINGTLKVPNVVLKGKSGSIDLSGDAINIVNNNSTYGLTLKSDGVAVGDKDRFYGLFTSSGIDLFTKSQDAPRPFSIGAIENDWLTTNHDIHGVSIIGKPYKDNKDNNFQGGNFINFGFQDPETTHNNPMISLYWRDLNVANDDKVEKGIHMYDDIYINHDIHLYKSPICVRTFGTQDPLMITGLKFGNSTQSDFFQPTLMAGWSNDLKGDSGLTFFWNSVKAFGTLDLTGTQIRMADAEANLEFGWVNWNDWTGKIPALFRRSGNNTGGIAVGGDCNVILFGNGHRWNLNQRTGY